MLVFVPVRFDLYRPLKPHLRWTMQCLVGFADKIGRCFPSVRKLAEVAGISKSTVARHVIELQKAGALTRRRRPGGGYVYQVDRRFLPSAAKAGVSHLRRAAVPSSAGIEEKTSKNKSDSLDFLPSEPWEQRLRGWKTQRFWLPQWGPKPTEPGCFAPIG
ncbi:MAG: helix-turn-helix domain-containing protein [Rhodopila sp.]